MRRLSCRSVPTMCSPPPSATPGPSTISVPRPAMLVAIVTAPGGTALAGDILDLVRHCLELRVLGLVDQVGVIIPDHRLVGGNHDHLQLVDLVELLGLGDGGTGHAG